MDPAVTSAEAVAADELAAIVGARHDHPHRVLGPHPSGEGSVIRAFAPGAVELAVLWPDGEREAMTELCSHEGLFELATTRAITGPADYQLEAGGARFHDPYAFAPTLGEVDLHLLGEGKHRQLYRCLGAHVREHQGVAGTSFAVWAPEARRVSVVGAFNDWDGRRHAMRRVGTGLWEIFLPGVGEGAGYKLEIAGADGEVRLKSDPLARAMELRPGNASVVTVRRHAFADDAWMEARARGSAARRPMSVYEVHLGSWRHRPGPRQSPDHPNWLGYRELADRLVDYVAGLGFSHVELLPVMEHPFDGSWGYQVSGYFAPTSRYGSPDDLRYLIDRFHQRGIGVLLDWVPAHFPKDDFALGRFDGTALYEHLDARRGEHRQWGTYVFNFGRTEVKNFLVANALYWLDEFHADGLRVDAVASMLYLDYGAAGPDDWLPNEYGGRENLDAIAFLRELCDTVHERFPGAVVIAEESTAWPAVTQAAAAGGLGFDLKWNMGWMHDTLAYFAKDPVFRAYHHQHLTFGLMYAFSERFLLPLSHDEVVHLKGSLLAKMAGDRWQKFANLRALYGHMWAHPGKQLLFMGGELGVWREWDEEHELDWALLGDPDHAGLSRWVADLNRVYRDTPALYDADSEQAGFRWIDANDSDQSVISYLRTSRDPSRPYVVCVANLTPVVRHDYRVGVPRGGTHAEVLNSDARIYGGSGVGNLGGVVAEAVPSHGFACSLRLVLPPLGVLWLVPSGPSDTG